MGILDFKDSSAFLVATNNASFIISIIEYQNQQRRRDKLDFQFWEFLQFDLVPLQSPRVIFCLLPCSRE
jgi:hypothetical protein